MTAAPASTDPPPRRPGPLPGSVDTRPRALVRRIALVVGVLVVVFGVVLPRMVDYALVGATLAGLSAGQVAALVAAAVLAWVANAIPYHVLVGRLALIRVVAADLAARAVASVIPGPSDVATRLVLFRGWGIRTDAAGAAVVLGGLLETLAALALPPVALAGLLVTTGGAPAGLPWLAGVSLAVLAIAVAGLVVLASSQGIAARAGRALESLARHAFGLLHRSPPAGIAASVAGLRGIVHDSLARDAGVAYAGAVGAKLSWFVVLELALVVSGVGPDVISPWSVLAVMAVSTLALLVPVTPGAVGVTEVVYVGLLTDVSGPGHAEQITAALVLFRLVQWLAPVVVGWFLLLVLRLGHPGGLLGGGPVADAQPRVGDSRAESGGENGL